MLLILIACSQVYLGNVLAGDLPPPPPIFIILREVISLTTSDSEGWEVQPMNHFTLRLRSTTLSRCMFHWTWVHCECVWHPRWHTPHLSPIPLYGYFCLVGWCQLALALWAFEWVSINTQGDVYVHWLAHSPCICSTTSSCPIPICRQVTSSIAEEWVHHPEICSVYYLSMVTVAIPHLWTQLCPCTDVMRRELLRWGYSHILDLSRGWWSKLDLST